MGAWRWTRRCDAVKRIVKRLCSIEFRVSLCGRNCEDANFIVVRKSKCLWAAGHLDGIGKKVRIMIGLVEPVSSMLMRRVPRKVGGLHISWLEADVIFRISWGGRALL